MTETPTMMSNEPRSEIQEEKQTITFRRTLAASPQRVFEAWTKPEQVAAWWDPTGTPLAECTIDLRPGGTFRFVNKDYPGPPFEGVYRVVEPPTKLVFDALGAVGTVLIEARGAETRLTVTIQSGSVEHFEQFVAMGIDTGTNRTLDNLVGYLAAAPS